MHNNEYKTQLSFHISEPLKIWLENEIQLTQPNKNKSCLYWNLINDFYGQSFLGKFLLKINYDYFQNTELQNLLTNPVVSKAQRGQRKHKYLKLIEKYLEQQERKKFIEQYRQSLYSLEDNDHNIEEILRLLLFMSIRSGNKQQFIQRIFILSETIQQSLMGEILIVENNLQNITEVKEIKGQLEYTKDFNSKLKEKYAELVEHQNKLLDQCGAQEGELEQLYEKYHEGNNQKLTVFSQLDDNQIEVSYLKLYSKGVEKNMRYVKLLTQKQKKQTEIYEQYLSLKQKNDEFQEVLFELTREKKKYKAFLNDKKNESFNLQMRASLRMSTDKENLRLSEAQRRQSLSLRDCRILGESQNMNSPSILKYLNCSLNSQMNQSMNIHSKIEELTKQRQDLGKQYEQLKIQNQKIRKRTDKNTIAFKQLSKIYNQTLNMLSTNILKPQKIKSKRYEQRDIEIIGKLL